MKKATKKNASTSANTLNMNADVRKPSTSLTNGKAIEAEVKTALKAENDTMLDVYAETKAEAEAEAIADTLSKPKADTLTDINEEIESEAKTEAKPKRVQGGKDSWGSRIGTEASKINDLTKRLLSESSSITVYTLVNASTYSKQRIMNHVYWMVKEGLITKAGKSISLAK